MQRLTVNSFINVGRIIPCGSKSDKVSDTLSKKKKSDFLRASENFLMIYMFYVIEMLYNSLKSLQKFITINVHKSYIPER
jgi:hypothetical protein